MSDQPHRRVLVPAAFAVILWIGAFVLFADEPGKWRDDYSWAVRNPVTQTFQWRDVVTLSSSWRPASVLLIRTLLSVFWNHDWVNHILAAAAHLLVVWRLFRLLRDLKLSRRISSSAAIGFMLLPWCFEVALWPAAIPTALATALWLCLASLVVRHARSPLSASGYVVATLVAALIPCLNEQPATGVASLPLICLAAAPAGVPIRHRLARAAVISIPCIAACVAYLLLLAATSRPELRGGANSYTSSQELLTRAGYLARAGTDLMVGRTGGNMVLGAFETGCAALRGARGIVWVTLAAIAAAFWIRDHAHSPEAPKADQSPRLSLIALAGLSIFILGWGMLVVIRRVWVEPRLAYFPSVGVIIAAAALAAAIVRRVRLFPRVLAVSAGSLTVAAFLFLAAGQVGFQTLLRTRQRWDDSQSARIHELWPNPPTNAVFIALRVEHLGMSTGRASFDGLENGPWAWDLFGTALLQHTLGRGDIHFRRYYLGGDLFMSRDGITTFLISRPGFERPPIPSAAIPWSRVVPFVIDKAGTVHAVRTIVLGPAGSDRITFPVSSTELAVEVPLPEIK